MYLLFLNLNCILLFFFLFFFLLRENGKKYDLFFLRVRVVYVVVERSMIEFFA